MSKAIKDIKNRVSKMRGLAGKDFCSCVAALDANATEQEWMDAWNTDQGIIVGIINDMELLCGYIEKEDYE